MYALRVLDLGQREIGGSRDTTVSNAAWYAAVILGSTECAGRTHVVAAPVGTNGDETEQVAVE